MEAMEHKVWTQLKVIRECCAGVRFDVPEWPQVPWHRAEGLFGRQK